MYHIKEAAQLSGVSVKTLHHYDKIGLLVPAKSENGYRTYSQADLERLQVILYYKYLGFSLEKIAELLSQDDQALLPHLVRQLEYLQQERDRLNTLISTLQKTIQDGKGERKIRRLYLRRQSQISSRSRRRIRSRSHGGSIGSSKWTGGRICRSLQSSFSKSGREYAARLAS